MGFKRDVTTAIALRDLDNEIYDHGVRIINRRNQVQKTAVKIIKISAGSVVRKGWREFHEHRTSAKILCQDAKRWMCEAIR